MLATFCQGFGEVAQVLVPEGSCCGWPFNEALVTLVTRLSVACLSMHRILFNGGIGFEASAPLVLDYY